MKTDTRERNTHRDYELSPMRFVVVQPINGETDWYPRAAFQIKSDADQWVKDNSDADLRTYGYPLEVREIGQEYVS